VLPLRYRWFWFGAGVATLALILVLALAPLPTAIPVVEGDKITHFAAFAYLAVWFLGIFQPRLGLAVAVALALYGILIELLQSLTPYRSADVYDVLADVIGIGAGWLLASAGLRRWCGRIEEWLGARPS
jgi:VanZ family protein